MNQRFECSRCGERRAYELGGFCLPCDIALAKGMRRTAQGGDLAGAIRAAATIREFNASPTPIAVEAPRFTNITNRKIQF